MVIKWDNQRERDTKLKQLGSAGLGVQRGDTLIPSTRGGTRYFGGLILRASLEHDALLPDNVTAQPAVRPSGIDISADGNVAYACGNKLLISPDGDLSSASTTIENPMFARLHSAAFSRDGRKILTASSSLDMLYEMNVDSGDIEWSMDLWSETPYNRNDREQSFHRTPRSDSKNYLTNPASSDLEDDEALRGAECVISDPRAYDSLGLATGLIPVFINTVAYESDSVLLATSFSRGEAWRINREEREIEIVARNLGRPHGLHVDAATDGYFVSDTLKEQFVSLDKTLKNERVYDLSGLQDRKEGLEATRWLQYTTALQPSVYCAVMTARQKLTLFNTSRKTRRDIDVHPDWGMQMVVPAPQSQ